jgi:hypothetical protein
MKLIREFSKFDLTNQISKELRSIFDYVKIKGRTILASSILDKSGNPLVRIDSKLPIKAIMILIDEDSVEIKSIVNTRGERGLFSEIMKVLSQVIKPGSLIKIDQDVSGGFWHHQIKTYPQFNWEIKD